MARCGVQKEDVFEIAEKLHQRGIIPTISNIRIFLGTGSYTTISRYLYAWKMKDSKIKKKNIQYKRGYGDAIKKMTSLLTRLLKENNYE